MSSRYAFSKALKEVRFQLCQTSEQSAAVRYVGIPPEHTHASIDQNVFRPRANTDEMARSFLTRAYPTMKKNNPQTPILIREAQGTLPKVYARYEFGSEKSQSLEGLTDKQVEDTVAGLVKKAA
ncbi:hypothetical protein ED733_004825 [Metarhizium rileyi]|uniref:Ribosomal protein/NADH dehydrogenase domain-containing protein n=1 Tax=Metarhizium rileyi (strain RCEF 4871) TaxID=1649241 RepID=A0A5C6GCX3_METRR|nr:hypothetical protein ED733_004825 [Metarhizium rileyi]